MLVIAKVAYKETVLFWTSAEQLIAQSRQWHPTATGREIAVDTHTLLK